MTRKTDVLRLIDLAGQKGFNIERSTVRDRWRLINGAGETVRKQDDRRSAAFTLREATRFLETMPDRIG